MNEGQYRNTGWAIFIALLLVAFYMCWTHTMLMAVFLDLTVRLTDNELVQISWLLTFLVFGIPGYMIKNIFEHKAWDAHVAAMPKPDAREAAKRSKYVQVDASAPSAPRPINLTSLPKGQEEFVATCSACGHFFSAKKGPGLKCPECGEPIPIK